MQLQQTNHELKVRPRSRKKKSWQRRNAKLMSVQLLSSRIETTLRLWQLSKQRKQKLKPLPNVPEMSN